MYMGSADAGTVYGAFKEMEWIKEHTKYRADYEDDFNVVKSYVKGYKYRCSACGWETGEQGAFFKYCPMCGEKAEKESGKIKEIVFKCKTCKWHDDFSWVCANGDSQEVADFTDNEYGCSCWEER